MHAAKPRGWQNPYPDVGTVLEMICYGKRQLISFRHGLLQVAWWQRSPNEDHYISTQPNLYAHSADLEMSVYSVLNNLNITRSSEPQNNA